MSESALASPTTEASIAATPAPSAPVSAAPETASIPGGDASAAAPSEDTFYSGDPNSLPPEIREHYNNMLKDYKTKTQGIAEERKTLAEVSKKAQAYDQITQDERFKQTWNALSRTEKADFKEQKAEAEKRLGEKISDEEFAKAFNSKDEFLSLLERVVEDKRATDQKKISALEQKVTLNEAADVIETIASEMKDGQPVRPDFYALNEDSLISGYLQVNPVENPSQYQEKVLEAYNWAKAVSSKYYEKGKTEALKIIQAKAQNSSEPPTISAKNVYAGKNPKNLDAYEAVALARKGTRVPQD